MNSNPHAGGSHQEEQLITLRNRNRLEINGVTDVISFDEESIVLSTLCGTLIIEGGNLHVQVLNLEKGTVGVDGKVDSLYYEDKERMDSKKPSAGILGKLFHANS